MGLKLEGIWKCNVLSASSGENDKHLIEVFINVEITEGIDIGKRCTYSEVIDGKSAQYAALSMMAVGWAGKTSRTLKDDVAAWIARTGGESTVEIKHLLVKSGKKAGSTWDKVGSIGRKPRELRPVSAQNEMLIDADKALADAIANGDFGGFGGDVSDEPPPDDIPHYSSGGGDAPQDDIPFMTCDVVREPSPIASILRGGV